MIYDINVWSWLSFLWLQRRSSKLTSSVLLTKVLNVNCSGVGRLKQRKKAVRGNQIVRKMKSLLVSLQESGNFSNLT